MVRDYNLLLKDIIEAFAKIKRYTVGMTYDDFVNDEKTLDAVLRNFEVIGEAVKGIPDNIRLRYPHMEWREMAGLRDIITHQYFGIDLEIIWDVIEKEVEVLEAQVKAVMPINNDGPET